MPQLQWLSLQSCVRITNATAFNIGAALPGLTSLNLRGCLQINDEGLGALSTLTRLTSLSVQGLVGLKGESKGHRVPCMSWHCFDNDGTV